MLKIGSHVSMSGKDMFLNSVKEAVSYHADTFMLYTGAPQNTKRKDTKDMHLPEGHAYMKEHDIEDFVVHAPYIINLGNSVNPDTYKLAVDFLKLELARTEAMGSRILILHPGAHVGAGTQAGIAQIAKGLNEVLQADTDCLIALETMAGKGSEIGSSFEELAAIYDKVHYNDKLRVCFDTCHVHDSGYDIIHHFDSVIQEFDKLLGLDQICVFHINDSKNPAGSRKDRHENIGFGQIGFDAINYIVHHKEFEKIPKILETPYVPLQDNPKKSLAPYAHEIEMLRKQQFIPDLKKADKSSSAF